MLDLISADVIAHGTKLHYYRSAGEKPAVVLVHGITDDGLCWTPVAEVLCAQYDVVLVDMRGHGESEAPEGGYTYETLATELAHLIYTLGIKKPTLLGHSMGAITALVLAGLFPDLPRAILLEDPPAFWNMDGKSPDNTDSRNHFREWIVGLKRKTHAELLAEVRAFDPAWPEAELEPWVNSKYHFSLNAISLFRPSEISSPEFLKLLRRITCPALLIGADPQRGAASNAADITNLKEYLPGLQVAHITGAGHNIRREQFARYMEVVQRALGELTSLR